ncbi:MAG: hypothetical protein QG638_2744 [Pseudomonadota bacterium]|nr:hypothetical protein [Pseudomonadota bacterium]MDQ5942416.1 hypothetical protein [Pseudomonadota bacterium]
MATITTSQTFDSAARTAGEAFTINSGAIAAHEFPAAIAEADGTPSRFVALDAVGTEVLSGSAGYRDDQPPPEMKFKTRIIVKDADVLVESFVFSVVTASGADQQTQ